MFLCTLKLFYNSGRLLNDQKELQNVLSFFCFKLQQNFQANVVFSFAQFEFTEVTN